jgi:hypothetical protein
MQKFLRTHQDFYQARWLGEADEAPIFNPAAVAAT